MSQRHKTKSRAITRRDFVSRGAAVAAVGATASLFSSNAVHAAAGLKASVAGDAAQVQSAQNCSVVHKNLSEKLTAMVADPSVSKEETSLALRSTFCPCCNTQISAVYPAVPLYPEFTTEARASIYQELANGSA